MIANKTIAFYIPQSASIYHLFLILVQHVYGKVIFAARAAILQRRADD